jgi:hypothetical protein
MLRETTLELNFRAFLHNPIQEDDSSTAIQEVIMVFTCPRCGRKTEIEEDIGDFPVRCHRCAALLRRKNAAADPPATSRWQMLPDHPESLSGRKVLHRGMLADMLGARASSEEAEPTVIHAHAVPAGEGPSDREGRPVLTRETRRVVQRVKARQRRVRRAELEGSRVALGALGWFGLVVVVLLSVGVLVLQTQAASHH